MITERENILRCIRFEKPEFIPMRFSINAACWHHYNQEDLKDLIESHSFLFPGYIRPSGKVRPDYLLNAHAGKPYKDPWGCVWETTDDGITGAVHGHPLKTWDDFSNYLPPDPEITDGTYPIDWQNIAENIRKTRDAGNLLWSGLPHGHTFLRLQDIRGYINLLGDMADGSSNLLKLIGMVADFNERFVIRCLALEPDIFCYGDDLGMQIGPMISPEHFRKYIKPVYKRLMKPALDKNCIVHMHSDGDIRTLVDDLVEAGVQVINLQDMVNGIDWIEQRFAGRVCIDLDIDRQSVTRFGSPTDVDALIREEVKKLGSAKGGLMMIYGMYPGIPLKNAKALMDAMEKYAGYWS
ncbi:MAG: hypothetical protein M1501_01530 [Candidatus Omnitrophica bacterium]|nr:hypothetical protein [Candidatus Omnitrophota bacterium]